MNKTHETDVAVTLSPELLRELRRESKRLGLPIQWLIASLVVDTVETVEQPVVAA